VGAGLDNLSMGVKYLGEPFGYAQGIARPYRDGKMWDKIYGKIAIALFIHPRQSACICGDKKCDRSLALLP